MKLSELVNVLGAAAHNNSLWSHPDLDPDINAVASIANASAGTLSFTEKGKFAAYITETAASALILPLEPSLQSTALQRGIGWIAAKQPRLLFARAIALFYTPFRPEPEIHPTAVIHSSARLGDAVYVGPHVVIQARVTIGTGVCIHPNAVIYPDASIGDRTVLHANCVIHERAHIGADCVIHSGAVIGSEGFGFVPTSSGWFKMEQSGRTVLEDGVEVGCNSTIDRPAVGETRVGRNTKIDNHVHIGHDCQVGANCAIAALVGLSGGVKVGDRVLLAGQVGVSNRITIGDGATASARAGIISDVEPGCVVSGHPAIPHRRWLRTAAIHKQLPELYRTIERLQDELETIQHQMNSLHAENP